MNSETHEEVKVEDLREGDRIDLENDEFADPFGATGYTEDMVDPRTNTTANLDWHDYEYDHDILGFEYAVVEGAVTDAPDPARPGSTPSVIVYTDLMNVRFPLGHTVKRLIWAE